MTWRMSDIFILIFAMVLSSNMIIVLVSFVQKLLGKYMDKQYLNYLFKIVILYLLVPLICITGFVLYRTTFRGTILANSEDFSHYYMIGTRTISTSTALGNYWFFILPIFIWGIGAIYFGIIRCFKDRWILKKLKKYSRVNQDTKLENLLSSISNELHIRKSVILYRNSFIPTPFMMGTFRVKIFLPEIDFSESEINFILRHELMHCKNGDFFYRRCIHYLCLLFWFNFAIYIITNSFLDINEMACDEAVLKNKSKAIRGSYGNLIIRIAEKSLPLKSAVALTGHTNNSLERRIENIMKRTNTNRKVLTILISSVIIFICPLTAIAATSGVSNLQNMLSEKIEVENSTLMGKQVIPQYVEHVESNSVSANDTTLIRITARGSSTIDCDISGKEQVITDTINLSKGNLVHIWITGNNSNDKFKAGLIDDNSHRFYVSSSEGEIDYTFTIKNGGDYNVFVEGSTNANIHVTGSITIKH